MRFGHPRLELLSRRLDGMLDPRNSRFLERHLARCSPCRRWAENLARVRQELRGLPAIEGGPAGPIPVPPVVPGERPALVPKWAVPALFAGFGVAAALLLFRPSPPAMRIISVSPPQMLLQSETALRALPTDRMGHVDLEIPGRLLIRLKPGATMTWQQSNGLGFGRRPRVVVNLMRGELLARTQESFWGSRLEIRTPTAASLVKGTAFAIQVDPAKDSTALKVLAGSVFFSPYLGKVGVEVAGGRMSRIQSTRLPEPPTPLSPAERQQLLEVYRIGRDPAMALVIGEGSERLAELLDPALLYLTRRRSADLQPFLRRAVERVNGTILEGGDLARNQGDLRVLEMAARSMADPERAVPLRLFVGACLARLGETERARAHFSWVAQRCPGDPRAPLALAAIGTAEARRQILARYPRSPEAALARESLKNPSH